MNEDVEFEKKINDLVELVDKHSELIFLELESKKIIDIKQIFKGHQFDFNPTKRKLIELLEGKLISKINEQRLVN